MAPALKSGRLALVGAVALGIASAGAQSLDEIYQKAKAEGAFTLYVGGPSAPWEARARTFEERYPGIKISITGGFSNVLDRFSNIALDDHSRTFNTELTTALELSYMLDVAESIIQCALHRLQINRSFPRPRHTMQQERMKLPQLRDNRCKFQGFRWCILRHTGDRHAVHVQYAARQGW